MKRFFSFCFFLLILALTMPSCLDGFSKSNAKVQLPVIKVYDTFDELEAKLNKNNDTTYVVNFWATTCPPCLKEMPHFEELARRNSTSKIKILLVSLDLKRHLESRVKPFIERLNITNEVGLLADQNYSAWTAKINADWFGALPYTVVYNHRNRVFYTGAFPDYKALEHQVSLVD